MTTSLHQFAKSSVPNASVPSQPGPSVPRAPTSPSAGGAPPAPFHTSVSARVWAGSPAESCSPHPQDSVSVERSTDPTGAPVEVVEVDGSTVVDVVLTPAAVNDRTEIPCSSSAIISETSMK